MNRRCRTCRFGARVTDVLTPPVIDDGRFRVCILDGNDGVVVEAVDACTNWKAPKEPLPPNVES